MNRSQLLYKINTLEYGISRKTKEYEHAVRANDDAGAREGKAKLEQLKKELAATRELFETPERQGTTVLPVANKKRPWWSFLFFRTAVDEK